MPNAATLPGGAAGEALFQFYVARASVSSPDAAASRLEVAAAALQDEPMRFGLHQGVIGIAWVIDHLCKDDPDDPVAPIDDQLRQVLESGPLSFDLVYGLVGFAVYALDRLPRPTARSSLERIVTLLNELATTSSEGVRWRAPDRDDYDLGLAHGAAGVIALLARVCATLEIPKARHLLRDGVAWLRSQRRPNDYSEYPAVVRENGATASDLAWCRSDLGIATSLLAAGRALADRALESEAIALALRCADRAKERTPATTFLCHGSAGVGHMFNRLWNTTGHLEFRDVAVTLFEQTLARWHPTGPGLLQGDSGIGLALLAAATETDPAWDRVLLLSG